MLKRMTTYCSAGIAWIGDVRGRQNENLRACVGKTPKKGEECFPKPIVFVKIQEIESLHQNAELPRARFEYIDCGMFNFDWPANAARAAILSLRRLMCSLCADIGLSIA